MNDLIDDLVCRQVITINDIKQALHEFDIINRPYAIFLRPDNAEEIKMKYPEINNAVLIKETELIEKDKAIVIKRHDLERWAVGMVNEE